jgi:hypothetical protein
MRLRYRRSIPSIVIFFLVTLVIGGSFLYFNIPQRWEAAVFWTSVTFAAVVELSRRRWSEVDFWIRIITIAVFHSIGMWLLFSRVMVTHNIPWLITLPLAWAEVVVILKIVNVRENKH